MGLFTGRNDKAVAGTTTGSGTGPRFIHNNEPAPTSSGVGHRYPTRSRVGGGPGTTTTSTNAVGGTSRGGLLGRNRGNGAGVTGPTTAGGTSVGRGGVGTNTAGTGATSTSAYTHAGQTNSSSILSHLSI